MVLSTILALKMDQNEIMAYQCMLPDLISQLPELELNLCTYFYGEFGPTENGGGYSSVIVSDDSKPKGYKMIGFNTEFMTTTQIELVIAFLAKLHFTSKSLELKLGKVLPEVYSFLVPVDPQLLKESQFYPLFTYGLEQIDKIFETKVGQSAVKVRSAFHQLAKHANEIVDKLLEPTDSNCPWICLLHGDLWSNNILWKDTTTCPAAVDFKVIDWKLLQYNVSTRDLSVFLLTSLKELSRQNLDQLIRFYYRRYLDYWKTTTTTLVDTADTSNVGGSEDDYVEYFYAKGIPFAFIWFVFSVESYEKDEGRLVTILEFLEIEFGVVNLLLEGIRD